MAINKHLDGIWYKQESNTPLYLEVENIDEKIFLAQQVDDKYWVIVNVDGDVIFPCLMKEKPSVNIVNNCCVIKGIPVLSPSGDIIEKATLQFEFSHKE